MAVLIDTNILNTVAAMGLATLREKLVHLPNTNRETEGQLVGATKNSTVNVIVPAEVTASPVTPSAVHPNDTPAVTPTKVPVMLTDHERAAFALTDKQQQQVAAGIVPMQVQEAVRGLANKIELSIAKQYKTFYGYVGVAGTTPFATDLSEFLSAEAVANEQLMPMDRRVLIMNSAASINFKGLRRTFDRNFEDIGARPEWSPFVQTHTAGTASGATTNTAGYALGVKTVTLASAGTGTILVGDIITFAGDTQTYAVTSGDADVSNGGSISFEPGLKVAIPTSATAISLKATHKVNLLLHPNAIAFAMAPMQTGMAIAGAPLHESTQVDPVSGLALRLTYFRGFYQEELSFDALWGSAVPRPGFGIRIAG